METIDTLGKYELKRTLGKGAMGTVYEGWDPVIARRVAVKTVRIPDAHDDPETAEALARFRREAQAAGRLTHPNIVGVFDYGETNDVAYIVMEYVDGPSVKSLVDRQERFAVADALRIMTDLLTGLQFSHARGVVHRDIKPANIMLTSEGQAKIADFGIARIESSSMTQAGTVLGTPAYMSPEQFMGQVVDARSDLYSAGVVLYQLLTGERPFEGGMSAIMHKALNTDPPLPSHLSVTCPPAFDGVVRKAMAKRPEDRFQSAAEFLDALQAAAAGRPLEGWDPEEANQEATMLATGLRRPRGLGTIGPGTAFAPPPAPGGALAGAPVAAPKRFPLPLIAAAVVVVLLLLGGGAWLFLGRGAAPVAAVAPSPATPQVAQAGAPAAAPPAAPAPAMSSPAGSPPSSASPPSATATAAPTPAASSATSAPAASSTPPAATAQTPGTVPAPAAAPQQVASAGVDTIRQQVTRLAATQDCALLNGAVGADNSVQLAGLAGAPEAAALHQALGGLGIAALSWRVNSVNPIFCPALNTLQPIVPAFGTTGSRLGLTLIGGNTRLHDGTPIMPDIVMPNFGGNLVVDYVGHDGTLMHLYPQVADAAQGMAADIPRVFRAGEAFELGRARAGHPAWEVGPPYGTDMIIAIASSQPLFRQPRPSDVESAATYLPELQAAVDAAQRRGDRLAGNALTVDTLPK